MRKHLARYAKEDYPLAFLIAKDGGYSVYWRCKGTNCVRDDSTYVASAQKVCRRFGHLGDCLVHSVRDQKVWPVEEVFETEVRSRLTLPWKYEEAGPEVAQGVILYVPGYGGHRFPPSLDHERVPAFLRALNGQGWDVLRLNIAHYDMSIRNEVEINRRIRDAVAELKAEGYQKVFLVGQSRGAWQILGVLADEIDVDGAILTAPAAHGRVETWSGEINPRFPRSSEDFQALVKKVRDVPLFVVLFDQDEYDPGDRGQTLSKLFPDRIGHRIHVLDRPVDFAGHGSAGHAAFSAAYNLCLQHFLKGDAPDFKTCRNELDLDNLLHAAKREHLVVRGATRLKGLALGNRVRGKAFHPVRGHPGWWGMLTRTDNTLLQWFPGSFLSGNRLESEWRTEDEHFCVVSSPRHNRKNYCYEIWALPTGETGFVGPDGLAFVVASQSAASEAELAFRPGDWKGEQQSATQ